MKKILALLLGVCMVFSLVACDTNEGTPQVVGSCFVVFNMARRWVLSLHHKHGQFDWAGPAILFACLVFSLTAPLYIWDVVGV